MGHRIINFRSIYQELAGLLLLAFGLAALFFLGVYFAGDQIINHYVSNHHYMESKAEELIGELRDYLLENQVSTDDQQLLDEWVKEKNPVYLLVFRDNILQYDSGNPGIDQHWEISSDNYAEWENYYSVAFADGQADVFLGKDFVYHWYVCAFFAELTATFLVFFAVIMLGIQKKIHYIRTLSQEIGILEGGDLDYPITRQGNDELSELADSLNAMRESFKNQTEQEAELTASHKKLITEMSHDLRTPLTSILIYTEILQNQKYKSLQQAGAYLEKINEKARILKRLTDHIFEYSLITSEMVLDLEPPASFEAVFSDALSEAKRYLEENGFDVICEIAWPKGQIRIHLDYLNRIMDNLTSNLLKYASREEPILMGTLRRDHQAGIFLRNQVGQNSAPAESSRIGLRNVGNMMLAMNGRCHIEKEKDWFQISLLFDSPIE